MLVFPLIGPNLNMSVSERVICMHGTSTVIPKSLEILDSICEALLKMSGINNNFRVHILVADIIQGLMSKSYLSITHSCVNIALFK